MTALPGALAAPTLAQAPGTITAALRIADGEAGFDGPLAPGDDFGAAAAPLGDVDGDGIADLIVGARDDDDGGTDRGAVWVLFLNIDGSVRDAQKISATSGGFTGTLDRNDRFGGSATGIGDLDGDGIEELAVGASGDDDGGTNQGATWLLFLNADGAVRSHVKIAERSGGFRGRLDSNDLFGAAVAAPGDLDGDGIADLIVGAPLDDDGGTDRGAVWILYLRADGIVRASAKISSTQGGFQGALARGDLFGESVASVGDLDGDGVPELAVGARGDDDGGADAGAVWLLFMNDDGTVRLHTKISNGHGNFAGALDPGDAFGVSVAGLGDLDDDGIGDLGAGAFFDDDGGPDRGAIWILFLASDGTVRAHRKVSATAGGFDGPLTDGDWFGSALGVVGDLGGDGRPELVVGARKDEGTGTAWLLSLHRDRVDPCPADVDRDGNVGPTDVDRVLDAWGSCDGCREDLDADGRVGFQDLLTVLRAWGACGGEQRARPWKSRRAIFALINDPNDKGARGRRERGQRRKVINHGIRTVRREYRREVLAEQRRMRGQRAGHTVQD